jgi:hypothetical protein
MQRSTRAKVEQVVPISYSNPKMLCENVTMQTPAKIFTNGLGLLSHIHNKPSVFCYLLAQSLKNLNCIGKPLG